MAELRYRNLLSLSRVVTSFVVGTTLQIIYITADGVNFVAQKMGNILSAEKVST